MPALAEVIPGRVSLAINQFHPQQKLLLATDAACNESLAESVSDASAFTNTTMKLPHRFQPVAASPARRVARHRFNIGF